jgi:hypothetical protein
VVAKRQFPSESDGDLETAQPLRTTPVVAGVYFLFKAGELTYVGRSNDCYGRIASHQQKGCDFDLATVMPLAMEFIASVEAALIDGFTPPQNRMRPAPQTPAPVFMAAPLPPDPYADVPTGAPRPSPLGLISPTQARELALHLGLSGNVIREAEDNGTLRFIDTGRKSGRGNIRAAVYDDVLTLLRGLRQDRLRELGLAPFVPSPIRSEGA